MYRTDFNMTLHVYTVRFVLLKTELPPTEAGQKTPPARIAPGVFFRAPVSQNIGAYIFI